MSYTRYNNRRLSPDIQTEWGTYTNPNITFPPNQYKYRQPAVPMLTTGRSDVIHPQPMGPQGLGYVGDYVTGPMGAETPGLLPKDDTLKIVLILAAIGLALYFLLKPDAKKNPLNVADMNALMDTGWTPPAGWGPSASFPAPTRRGRTTRRGKKSQSRHAKSRRRIPKGQPGAGTFI